MRPIAVYLDSADYSVLSDPRGGSGQLSQIRENLLDLSKKPQVCFAYSGVHLSEMAPLKPDFATVASARTELLLALCGRNALISFDRLIAAELASLIQSENPQIAALTSDATWFPEFDDICSPVNWAKVLQNEVRTRTLNRKSRRTLRSELLKSTRLRSSVRQHLLRDPQKSDFDAILRRYPMRPKDFEIIRRHVLGLASSKEVEDAFLASLRDPRWMMKWFSEHHSKLQPLVEWFRAPAANMRKLIAQIVSDANRIQQNRLKLGKPNPPYVWTHKDWIRMQDTLLLNIINQEVARRYPTTPPIEDVAQIDERCAGIATFTRSLHSSIWNSVSGSGRAMRESDVVDAVHAMYAPYVRLFRADRFMAPHIGANVKRYGTTVVASLGELPDAIHRELARHGRNDDAIESTPSSK